MGTDWLFKPPMLWIPKMEFAHPLGRFQPCVDDCCVETVDCDECKDGVIPKYLSVTISGIGNGDFCVAGECASVFNGTFTLEYNSYSNPEGCRWVWDPYNRYICDWSEPPQALYGFVNAFKNASWLSVLIGRYGFSEFGGYRYASDSDDDCLAWSGVNLSLYTPDPAPGAFRVCNWYTGTVTLSAVS